MKILNIAEKPSVAKSISAVLTTHSRVVRGRHKYCPNIFFERGDEMIFTSVLGHLYSWDFGTKTGWGESNPYDLFDAPVAKSLAKDMDMVAENIRGLARQCGLVVIWTDCDREGENIAMQIKGLVGSRPVKRARFSAISRAEVEDALDNLVEINERESAAVDARIELDLRIGSAFTRFQTLAYGSMGPSARRLVLSFGPCQIPTLNFVVQRHDQILNFVSERFYSLDNSVVKKGAVNCFKWRRGPLFAKNCVLHFYHLLRSGSATVANRAVQNREKLRPLPLRTVEFQKVCSSCFRMPGHTLMDIAEKLYNNGYISYPRTETDSFGKSFNFAGTIKKLQGDSAVGEYASDFAFKYPRSGRNDDQAHSPIYPLKSGSDLKGDERRVYEFIARRFLGCVSENARGVETEYTLTITYDNRSSTGPASGAASGSLKREEFVCTGLTVTERNYLDVYIYDRWESVAVSDFAVGERVANSLEMTEGATTAPEYLTESDLIALMDKHGIGTDATIHEHIQKIQIREYARKEKFRFIPTPLGVNLIKVYTQLDLHINEPTLRKNLEESLKLVCAGAKDKEQLVKEEVGLYRRIYRKLEDGAALFKRLIKSGVDDDKKDGGPGGQGGNPGGKAVACKRQTASARGRSAREGKENLDRDEGDEAPPVKTSIECNCGKQAKRCVAKKGARNGVGFYGCHSLPKRCDFFAWEDEAPKGGREKRRAVENRTSDTIKCDCGYDTIIKTARTEANNGRAFYCCNKNYKRCKFFKWADDG